MIIVFGSINCDFFFDLDELPRPGLIAKLDSYKLAPGGKGGNQAVAAALGGSPVELFGCTGADPIGDYLINDLKSKGVGVSGVKRANCPSGISPIFRSSTGEQRSVYACAANAEVLASQVPDSLLTSGTTVLVQGDTPMSENHTLLKRARERHCRTVLNLGPPSPIAEDTLQLVDVLVVNQHEAAALAASRSESTADIAALAGNWARGYGFTCVITLGADGVLAVSPDGNRSIVQSLQITPIDTVGAGDAFIGFLCAALDQNVQIKDALKLGAVAGALTCLKLGAQSAMPTLQEVRRLASVG